MGELDLVLSLRLDEDDIVPYGIEAVDDEQAVHRIVVADPEAGRGAQRGQQPVDGIQSVILDLKIHR